MLPNHNGRQFSANKKNDEMNWGKDLRDSDSHYVI